MSTVWKEIQAERRSEGSHGKVHEQVRRGHSVPDQPDQHHLADAPPDDVDVDPLDPDDLGHLEPGLHALPAPAGLPGGALGQPLETLVPGSSQGFLNYFLHISNKFNCAFEYLTDPV